MQWKAWGGRMALGATLAAAALLPWVTPRVAVEAAPLTVTKTADTDDGVCDADCSLREAINAANSGDTVNVPAGTYVLSIAGVGEDAGATGDLDVTVDLTIDGAGSGSTIIDANDIDRVLDVRGAASVSLSGLTVRDGTAPAGAYGGGIQSGSGALTLDDVIVTQNASTSLAGGIYAGGSLELTNSAVSSNQGDQGGGIVTLDLTMTDSSVDDNSTTDQGGGIWACCGDATFTITGSTVDGNASADQGGGIFHCCGALQLTVTDTSVSGNSSLNQGGGIFFCCGDDVEATAIVVTDSTIDGNTATADGGGLYSCCDNGPPITITIVDTAITNNEAGAAGGGVYDCCGSALTLISGSVISGNQAGTGGESEGGGIYSDADELVITNTTISGNGVVGGGGGVASQSTDGLIEQSTISGNDATSAEEGGGGGILNLEVLRIVNSTISGNTTNARGGGILNDFELELSHVTLADNTAGDLGDQIFNDDTATVANTIIAGSADNCGTEESSSAVISLGNNIDSGTSCGLTDPGDLEDTDPLIGGLADNGGATLTRALLTGSPAIDAADGDQCNEVDQRDVARPVGPACDIGAYEGESEGDPPTATPTATPTEPAGDGGGDITAPHLGATEVPAPQPTTEPPVAPTEPAATATAPGGGAGAGVIAPDTGMGPGAGTGRAWLVAVAAALAAIAGGGAMVIGARRG